MTSVCDICYFLQMKEGFEFCVMSLSHERFFLKTIHTGALTCSLSSTYLMLLNYVILISRCI